MTLPLRVLVIDDERNIRVMLCALVQSLGHEATAAASAAEAEAAIHTRSFDVAFLDLKLGAADGLALLPRLLDASPGLLVILMTAFATVPTAVEAIRRGARDYLPKPFEPEKIRLLLDQLAAERAVARRLVELESRLAEVPEADFETESPAMAAVYELASRVAQSEASVLLRGESGTGKGVLARFLHLHSRRASAPFVVVNCPTLTEDLLASELFGHVRGAFTGAVKDAPGRVATAEGGSLFLDEIAEVAPSVQARLLRFLQDRQYERVGEARTRSADVRVLAATNRLLEEEVRRGRFREDLLYRLNVIELTMPPLRERREDIPRLARRYLAHFARAQRRRPMVLSDAALAELVAHAWPGNLRELRNTLERAVILAPGDVLGPGLVVGAPERPRVELGADVPLEELEREHILRVLARHPTAEEAARVLGIDPATLWRKRRRWEAG